MYMLINLRWILLLYLTVHGRVLAIFKHYIFNTSTTWKYPLLVWSKWSMLLFKIFDVFYCELTWIWFGGLYTYIKPIRRRKLYFQLFIWFICIKYSLKTFFYLVRSTLIPWPGSKFADWVRMMCSAYHPNLKKYKDFSTWGIDNGQQEEESSSNLSLLQVYVDRGFFFI